MSEEIVKITTVDVYRKGKAILINLSDESCMEVTMEQILGLSLPRYFFSEDDLPLPA